MKKIQGLQGPMLICYGFGKNARYTEHEPWPQRKMAALSVCPACAHFPCHTYNNMNTHSIIIIKCPMFSLNFN